jgi:hypothetical protein
MLSGSEASRATIPTSPVLRCFAAAQHDTSFPITENEQF